MLTAHFLDTDDYQFGAVDRETIESVCRATEADLRERLPMLPSYLHLVVEPGNGVIVETGEVGFTMAPHAIKWTVDPARNVASVASAHLRHVLFHESHHAARLLRYPEEAYTQDWASGAIFEGLATLFERESGEFDPPWGRYEASTIESWAEELLAQPVDGTYTHWKFEHPDGRRWIAYRVGTWIAERATEATGRTAADMVWVPIAEVMTAAGLPYTRD